MTKSLENKSGVPFAKQVAKSGEKGANRDSRPTGNGEIPKELRGLSTSRAKRAGARNLSSTPFGDEFREQDTSRRCPPLSACLQTTRWHPWTQRAGAGVVKLVDTLDLGSSAARCAGSSPVPGSALRTGPVVPPRVVGSLPACELRQARFLLRPGYGNSGSGRLKHMPSRSEPGSASGNLVFFLAVVIIDLVLRNERSGPDSTAAPSRRSSRRRDRPSPASRFRGPIEAASRRGQVLSSTC